MVTTDIQADQTRGLLELSLDKIVQWSNLKTQSVGAFINYVHRGTSDPFSSAQPHLNYTAFINHVPGSIHDSPYSVSTSTSNEEKTKRAK